MKVFPKSVFVLLPEVQNVKNLPIHDDKPSPPFTIHMQANCVRFSVPEINLRWCICFVRSVAIQWKMAFKEMYMEGLENFLQEIKLNSFVVPRSRGSFESLSFALQFLYIIRELFVPTNTISVAGATFAFFF